MAAQNIIRQQSMPASAHAFAQQQPAEPPRSAKAYKLADTLVRKLLLESEAHSVTFTATPRRQVGKLCDALQKWRE